MNEKVKKLIEDSRMAHVIMPYDETETTDYRLEKKPVIESFMLDDCESLDKWQAITPYATVTLSDKESYDGTHSVLFTCPTNLDTWLPDRGFGRIYAEPKAMRVLDHEDLRDYNRLSVWIKPDVPGMRSLVVRLQLHNEGTHKVPDKFEREGHHNVNLKNGQWNHITCEIPQLDRDDTVGIAIEYDMVGHEFDAADTIKLYIDKLELQKVEPEMYKGWTPGKGRIAFSGSGYKTFNKKQAVMAYESAGKSFKIVETQTGKTVLEKPVKKQNDLAVLDFSSVTEAGNYIIVCGDTVSRVVYIGDDSWEASAWKVLNFYLSQRCGYEVVGKHHACHKDVVLSHNGKSIIGDGGWHDAADLAQGLGNTCNGTIALFLLANKAKLGGYPLLYERAIEEARWGLAYVLKTRFGDGYRSSYSSISIWTDGVIGTNDDVPSEPHDDPNSNFAAACAEALGAIMLKDSDPYYAEYCLKIAKEDFFFGERTWKQTKEESDTADYFSSHNDECKLLGVACSAAALMYEAGDTESLDKAVEYARGLMACQQTEAPDWDIPLTGFFWKTSKHQVPTHHAHHSYEQFMTFGISELLKLLPNHEDAPLWKNCLELYVNYTLKIARYTDPWGMIPEGVYHENEAIDYPQVARAGIIQCDDDCVSKYKMYVQQGIPLGKGWYLRKFPVWFSFRGNCSVQLSHTSALAMAGNALGNKKALALSEKQLQWMVGANPFAQSMVFGEGYDWTNEYCVQPGQTVGQIPVGMQSYFEEDVPYWPQICTATYKEVWIESANRWMWVLSQVL